MSERLPFQERPVMRRVPDAPLTPAHKALITMLAEVAVRDYLAELAEEEQA